MSIKQFIKRRYVASFNRERIGFRSRWIAAVFYLKRGTYEIWLLGKCWMNHNTSPADRIDYFSLSRDPIPEAIYLGSTSNGEQFKIGEPTRTMIDDAGPPSTFVQDKLAEAFGAVPKVEVVISFPEVENVDFKPIDRSDRAIEGRVSIRLNGDEKLAFPVPAEIKDNTIRCAGFSLPEEAQELFQTLLAEALEPELKPVESNCSRCGKHSSQKILVCDNTIRCPYCGTVSEIAQVDPPEFPSNVSIKEGDQPT